MVYTRLGLSVSLDSHWYNSKLYTNRDCPNGSKIAIAVEGSKDFGYNFIKTNLSLNFHLVFNG